jgi:hypothetical protein
MSPICQINTAIYFSSFLAKLPAIAWMLGDPKAHVLKGLVLNVVLLGVCRTFGRCDLVGGPQGDLRGILERFPFILSLFLLGW